jgi:hypothetical protein
MVKAINTDNITKITYGNLYLMKGPVIHFISIASRKTAGKLVLHSLYCVTSDQN